MIISRRAKIITTSGFAKSIPTVARSEPITTAVIPRLYSSGDSFFTGYLCQDVCVALANHLQHVLERRAS